MSRTIALALAAAVTACVTTIAVDPAAAGSRSRASATTGDHPASAYYRSGTRVRGYVQRRGGYSYSPEDTVNTYGDARTLYGSTNTYRDPMLDRQTPSGPFDHGWFFDSGIGPRGGNSPYMN